MRGLFSVIWKILHQRRHGVTKVISKTVTARDRRRLQSIYVEILGRLHGIHEVPKTSRIRIMKTLVKFIGPEKKASIVAETQGNEGQMCKKVHEV